MSHARVPIPSILALPLIPFRDPKVRGVGFTLVKWDRLFDMQRELYESSPIIKESVTNWHGIGEFRSPISFFEVLANAKRVMASLRLNCLFRLHLR